MPAINFFNDTNMSLFWQYSKNLLSTAAPGIMIWFAVVGVGLLLGIIVKAWKDSQEEEQEDYDYKEY